MGTQPTKCGAARKVPSVKTGQMKDKGILVLSRVICLLSLLSQDMTHKMYYGNALVRTNVFTKSALRNRGNVLMTVMCKSFLVNLVSFA